MIEVLEINKKTDNQIVPDYLIYEILNDVPMYYRNYKAVLNNHKKLEEIMGSSGLQSYFVALIVEFLLKNISNKTYKILYNELGLHLEKRDNLSADIAIYEKKQLKEQLTNKYLVIAPKIVIEVDTKIEFDQMSASDYVHIKTEKLLNFGVEKVIWIFTESEKVLVAEAEDDWRIKTWEKEIQLLETTFSIAQLKKDDGILT